MTGATFAAGCKRKSAVRNQGAAGLASISGETDSLKSERKITIYSIEIMTAEHDNIIKMLSVVRNACCGILNGREIDDSDFRRIISFIRDYADKHHHGKEEKILFVEMAQHLGQIGVNLIQHGMLVEHDLGRQHIAELEAALNRYREGHKTIDKLNILTEAMGYVNLLQRHIDKENEVVYSFAEQRLPKDILQSVDERIRRFEEEAEENRTQATYLRLLHELQKKYGCAD